MVKLYIGNLPYSATSESLHDDFSEFATPADVQVIEDRETGRSKGFGFVSFHTKEEANVVEKEFNGKELGGRILKVSPAMDKPRTNISPKGYQDAFRDISY